jgi:ribosome recycling factor
VISLWDSAMIKNVEKAIQQSNIGINPTNDGKVIRLLFPELTEERRKELVKSAHRMAEENRVVIRTIRRDAIEDLNRQKKANLLTEDDLKQEEKDVQKITDDFIKDIDLIMSEKEKEILAI